MSRKERHHDHHGHRDCPADPPNRADQADQSTVRQSAMDKVVITFYVSSLSMLKKIPGQVYEMFSDEDMKNLAESIAQSVGVPVDIMIRRQECFRRCYNPDSFDEDKDTLIIGVSVTGNIYATVDKKINDRYSNASKIRIVQDEQ